MNRLAGESSPYLRQHAANPVDWYPWGEEAFDLAEQEDKPILLSVGYSSCHWCHVMAHESFETKVAADVMNELFVNVKVDREERPDIDAVYMEAVQTMTGQGGWPMTVFLTPDARPFFAGTYFPPETQGGRPGFIELLHAVDDAWKTRRPELDEQADALRSAINERTHSQAVTTDVRAHGAEWLAHAQAALSAAYDSEWGGFGHAPKFPQASALELLLRLGGDSNLAMVVNSLDAMASGGIYDQVGGGFSRYSVDSFWMVPHFEKMLYDQASLATVYLHAFQVTGERRFAQVVEEIVGYVQRDLATPAGGWCSAEDADSEGEEGRFYLWRPEDIDDAVDDSKLAAQAKSWYGVTPSGNFEGSNILHRPNRGDLLRSDDIEEARAQLLAARTKRIRPGLDDKVLTEWNAMFTATLAEAGAALGKVEWVSAAERSAQFLLDNIRDDTGRWLRAWHSIGGARNLAYANDYAWLVEAFTRLSEATGRALWRHHAVVTADEMIRLFWDDDNGGFFTTGHDGERLIVRTKDLFDGASSSANSTAAVALTRLGAITGNDAYARRAEQTIAVVAEPIAHHPTAFTTALAAVDQITTGSTEVVIAGDHPELVEAVTHAYLPQSVLLWGERDDSPLWEGRDDGAFVCREHTCGPRAMTADQLRSQLAIPPL